MRCSFLWVPVAIGQSIAVSFAFSEQEFGIVPYGQIVTPNRPTRV